MQHNATPTTCTASLITGWSNSDWASTNEKTRVNGRLQAVNSLISAGYKRDFAILHVFVTDQQVKSYALDDFLPKIGFEKVFHGVKDDEEKGESEKHRHKETGDLWLYAARPKEYQKSLKAYKAELEARKDIIDPPKKPDPARQLFPELRVKDLREAGIVQPNTKVDNPLDQVLLVTPAVMVKHIKMKFGMNIEKWFNLKSRDFTKITGRQLKEAHIAWKAELV